MHILIYFTKYSYSSQILFSLLLSHRKLWKELISPCMDYISISIKPYIKSHLELQREITLIELARSLYFFVQSICLPYMNMFARFDKNPAMTLQDIKETKCYWRRHAHRHAQRDGQHENSIHTLYKVCGGYNENSIPTTNKVCRGV